jgi:anti-sigma-K factor RskA
LRHDRQTEQGQELAALYALGALTQHEARAFESHLNEGCEICKVELEEFGRVVGALGSSAPAITPDSYLRNLLEARIEKESRLPKTESSGASPVIAFPGKGKSAPASIAPTTPKTGRVWLPWAIAASLLIALAYSVASWQSDRQTLRASLIQNQDEAQQLKSKLDLESARANEFAQINSALQSPQTSRVALTGQETAPSSAAMIYWDIQGRRWVVSADLPPAPAGKVYQLWFVTPDSKVSAGLIEPDDRGHGFAVIKVPQGVDNIAAAAITLEPKGGSEQPTLPIFALGKIG